MLLPKGKNACSTHCHEPKDYNNKHSVYEDKKDCPQDKKEECEPKSCEHDNNSSRKDRSLETEKMSSTEADVEKDATAKDRVHAK